MKRDQDTNQEFYEEQKKHEKMLRKKFEKELRAIRAERSKLIFSKKLSRRGSLHFTELIENLPENIDPDIFGLFHALKDKEDEYTKKLNNIIKKEQDIKADEKLIRDEKDIILQSIEKLGMAEKEVNEKLTVLQNMFETTSEMREECLELLEETSYKENNIFICVKKLRNKAIQIRKKQKSLETQTKNIRKEREKLRNLGIRTDADGQNPIHSSAMDFQKVKEDALKSSKYLQREILIKIHSTKRKLLLDRRKSNLPQLPCQSILFDANQLEILIHQLEKLLDDQSKSFSKDVSSLSNALIQNQIQPISKIYTDILLVLKDTEVFRDRLKRYEKSIENLSYQMDSVLSNVNQLQKESKKFIFDAVRYQDFTCNGNLTYEKSIVNEGNGLNVTTGVFTAPYKGFYLFNFHANTITGNDALILFRRNGETFAGSYDTDNFNRNTISQSAIVLLKENDSVWIDVISGGVRSNDNIYLHFIGILLK
ncbi:C1QL [Lepeophtheirus salmonis]|uniref:C1QL n=1 Tax=Lepeophtheirus salmonis TaxID=72036 RepID=A0A7R8CQ56_LEPSM|nr:C1QL [Lepeophtheirus salmonis]CAF2892096.1 C1QL [Lepeophtheirus salmonis]